MTNTNTDINVSIFNIKYLELNSQYESIYKMYYITPELCRNSIALISTLNIYFSEYSMVKYFGNKQDLSCKEVRELYQNLISYFITLFILKISEITKIDITTLDDNDEYICLLAQCTNIIRAGIKKYSRLRTSTSYVTSKICSKSKLNIDDANTYNCKLPIGPYDQCPSFNYLHAKKGKTCKHILKSSETPNKFVSLAAKALPNCGKRNIKNITFKRNRTTTRRRRHIQNKIPDKINIIDKVNIYNTVNNNSPYKSVHIVNSKNIPEVSNSE